MIELKPAPNGYMSPQDPGEPGRNQPRWSVNDREARIIGELCRGLDVLEIGTGLGISTKAINEKAADLDTVDIDLFVQQNIFPELKKLGVFCHNSFEDCVKDMDPDPKISTRWTALFLDGFHEYNQVKKDIAAARPWLAPGAIMIFHDLYIDGVYRGIIDSGLAPLHIQTVAGIGVCWND
jgi:hypothetical protein